MSASAPIDTAPGGNKIKISAGLIILIICSLVGFIFYGLFDKSVFPAASIDFKLNKTDAAKKATEMAKTVGYDTQNNLESTTFAFDDDAKTVLEFKLGIDQANKLMKEEVPVWSWRTRFCKPLANEQLVVWWTTHGQLSGFDHTIDNDKKLPNVPIGDARQLAKDFVEKTANISLAGYELTEEGSETKPHRIDHHFLWRKLGYPESELKAQVEVAGNLVREFRYFLAPRDNWTREYKKIRETNELLGSIASFLFFGFLIGAVVAFVNALSRHDVRWKFTLMASTVVSVLVALEQWNNFDYSLNSYVTSQDYTMFLLMEVATALMYAVLAFVATVLIAGGGETMYRRAFPQHTAAEFLFTLKGMMAPGVRHKMLMGYLLPGVMMLWTISYYKLGQKVGFFCPLGVDDYNVLGNYCPAISGALIGVTAAGMEEFLCRVVGLSLFQRIFKNFWVANFLQAVIWGFAHSTYPQEPAYARGLELTMVGLLFGWIVKSYGVLPCLIAHYLYDAFLTVEPVFASKDALLIVPSIAVLFPFLILGWLGWRASQNNKVAVGDADISNSEVTGVPAAVPETVVEVHDRPLPYQPLSVRACLVLLVVAAVGLGTALIGDNSEIGHDKQMTIRVDRAVADAKKILADYGLQADGYSHVSQLMMKPDKAEVAPDKDWQYIFETLGQAGTAKIYNESQPGIGWMVRFYKEHVPKSYSIFINGTGRLRGAYIDDVETAPGAKLTEDAAKKVAEDYVSKVRPEFVPFKFDSLRVKNLPNRKDYEIDYLVPKFDAGSTPCKITVHVMGDKVITIPITWDVPDEWSFARKKQAIQEQISGGLRALVSIIILVTVLIWSIHVLRSASIPWRAVMVFGSVLGAANAVRILNFFSPYIAQYNTAETFDSFISKTVAQEATKFVVILMAELLICIIGLASLRYSFPEMARQITSKVLLAPYPGQRQKRTLLWRDAVLASYAFLGVLACLHLCKGYFTTSFSPAVQIDVPSALQSIFSATVPSLDILSGTLSLAVLAPFALAVSASVCKRYLASESRLLPVLLLLAVIGGTASKFWKQCVIDTAYDFVLFIMIWFFITRVFKLNALSYLFVALELVAVQNLSVLLAHAQAVAMPEIAVAVTLLILPILGLAAVWLKDRGSAAEPADPL